LKEADSFKKLCGIVARLRGPGGCPWDREQTPLSLRGDLIEETYECIEAINENDPSHVKEELGDIFLLVTMLAYMYEQEGTFTISDVLDKLSEKLTRRHPHVFGTSSGGTTLAAKPAPGLTTDGVLQNWAKIKVEQEGRKPKDSILDEVSSGLPPLDRAWKLQKKAAKAGFDWPDAAGVIAKTKEELAEVEAAVKAAAGKPVDANLEEELGDLLFSAVNLCRFFDVEPSIALQRTNIKFTERFKHVEKRMKGSGEEMIAGNLDIMDNYWNEAKSKT
jgi:tetrapyrrole methylase family protein/MazG family protein